jgi:hypothetical protein
MAAHTALDAPSAPKMATGGAVKLAKDIFAGTCGARRHHGMRTAANLLLHCVGAGRQLGIAAPLTTTSLSPHLRDAGGIAVTAVGHPFDTIKVRLQTQPMANPIYGELCPLRSG